MSDDEARRLPVVIDAATLAAFGSTTWATDAGPIDVLHDLPTDGGRRSFDDLASTAVTASLDGIVIRVAALAEIIASKRHAGRDKDRDALPELEELETRRAGSVSRLSGGTRRSSGESERSIRSGAWGNDLCRSFDTPECIIPAQSIWMTPNPS